MGHGSGEQQARNAAVVAALRALSLKRLAREKARRLLLAGSLVAVSWLVPIVGASYRLHEERLAQEDAVLAKRARVEARCAVLAKRREEIQQDMNSELAIATSEQARLEIRSEAAWRVHHLTGLRAMAGCLPDPASVRAAPPPEWRSRGDSSESAL